MQKFKRFCHFSFLIWIPFVILTSGCASIKEVAKGIAGVSTKVLEDNRKDAIKKTFNYDYNTCHSKVKLALKEIGSYIYAEEPKKNMVAIYVSEADTTPVGLFFKEIDKYNTQIEVSSPSTYAKEAVAKNVFSVLEGTYKPKAEKGQPDEKKETGY